MPQDTNVSAEDIKADIKKQEQILTTVGYGDASKEQAKIRLQKYRTAAYERSVRLAAAKVLLDHSNDGFDFDSLKTTFHLFDFTMFDYVKLAIRNVGDERWRSHFNTRLHCFWSQLYLNSPLSLNSSSDLDMQWRTRISVAKSLADLAPTANDPSRHQEGLLAVYKFYLHNQDRLAQSFPDLQDSARFTSSLASLDTTIANMGSAFESYVLGLKFEAGFFNGYVDRHQAFIHFQKACAQPDAIPYMWFNLAGYYAQGLLRDPKQERTCLETARRLLRDIPILGKDDADAIYVAHLKQLLHSGRSSVALEFLKKHYEERIQKYPVLQSAGFVQEFSEILSVITENCDDADFLQYIKNAKRRLAEFQQKYQQGQNASYVEQLVEYHDQVLMDRNSSHAEITHSREQLAQLSRERYIYATAKLAGCYRVSEDRRIYYNSWLAQLDPQQWSIANLLDETEVVMWFHAQEQLPALCLRQQFPTKQQVEQIISKLTTTAEKFCRPVFKMDLDLRLYMFYQMFISTLANIVGKTSEMTELEIYVKQKHLELKEKLQESNPQMMEVFQHFSELRFPKVLKALENAVQSATCVTPFMWALLAQCYSDPEVAYYRDEQGNPVSNIDPENERRCLQNLKVLCFESRIHEKDISELSIEVSLRFAIVRFHSVTALNILKDRYLERMVQCEQSKEIDDLIDQFQDDIREVVESAEFGAHKKQAVAILTEQRRFIMGMSAYDAALKFFDDEEYQSALQQCRDAAEKYGHSLAQNKLPLYYVKAAAVILKHEPALAQEYLTKAVELQPNLMGEVNLIYARAAVNGYHPDMPGKVSYAKALKLCQAVFDANADVGIDRSCKIEIFKFLYEYAFYEHAIYGYLAWLCNVCEPDPILQFYIALNLTAEAQYCVAPVYTFDQQPQVTDLLVQARFAVQLLNKHPDIFEYERSLFKAKLDSIVEKCSRDTELFKARYQTAVVRSDALPAITMVRDEKVAPQSQNVTLGMFPVPEDRHRWKEVDPNLPAWQTPMPIVYDNISPPLKQLCYEFDTSPDTRNRNRKQLQAYCKPPHKIADRMAAANKLREYHDKHPLLRLHYDKLIFQLGDTAAAFSIVRSYQKSTLISKQSALKKRRGGGVHAIVTTDKTYKRNYQQIIDFWAQNYLLTKSPLSKENIDDKLAAADLLMHKNLADKKKPENYLVVYEFYLRNYSRLTDQNHSLRSLQSANANLEKPFDIYMQGLRYEYGYPTGVSDHALALRYFKAATKQAPQHVTAWMWFKLAEFYVTGKGMEQADLEQARFCFKQARIKMSNIQDFPQSDVDNIYLSKLKELYYHYHNRLALQLLQEFYQERIQKVAIEECAGIVSEFHEVVSAVIPHSKDKAFLHEVRRAIDQLIKYQQEYLQAHEAEVLQTTIETHNQVLSDKDADQQTKQTSLLALLRLSREGNYVATTALLHHYCLTGEYEKAADCINRCQPESCAAMLERYQQSVENHDRDILLLCRQQLTAFLSDSSQLLLTNNSLKSSLSLLGNMLVYSEDEKLIHDVKLFLFEFYAKAIVVLGQVPVSDVIYQNAEQAIQHYRLENVVLFRLGLDESMGLATQYHGYDVASPQVNNITVADAHKQFELATLQADSVPRLLTVASYYTGINGISADPDKETHCLNLAQTLAYSKKDSGYAIRLREYLQQYQSTQALNMLVEEYQQRMRSDPQAIDLVAEEFQALFDFPVKEEQFKVLKDNAINDLMLYRKKLAAEQAYVAALKYTEKAQHELALKQYLAAAELGHSVAKTDLPRAYLAAGEFLISSTPIFAMDYFVKAIRCDTAMNPKVDLVLARAAINGYHPERRGIADFQLALQLCMGILDRHLSNDESVCIQTLQFLYENAFYKFDISGFSSSIEVWNDKANVDLRFYAKLSLMAQLEYWIGDKFAEPQMQEQVQRLLANVEQALVLHDQLSVKPAAYIMQWINSIKVCLGADIPVARPLSPGEFRTSNHYLHAALGASHVVASQESTVDAKDEKAVTRAIQPAPTVLLIINHERVMEFAARKTRLA